MRVKKNKFGTLSRGILLIFATLSLTADGALAQQTAIAACAADIKSLCAGVTPGEGRLEACIKSHSRELSEGCRAALLKDAALRNACAIDIKQNCAGVPSGGGRIGACMKAHFANLSEACKRAFEAVAPNNR
jgi:Cysteine rich repeat